MQADWSYNDWTLTSITAYRNRMRIRRRRRLHGADILATNLNDSTIDTFTQALRFAFDNGGPVTGLIGATTSTKASITTTRSPGQLDPAGMQPASSSGIPAFTALSDLEAALGRPPGTLLQEGQGQVITTQQDSEVTTVFGQPTGRSWTA